MAIHVSIPNLPVNASIKSIIAPMSISNHEALPLTFDIYHPGNMLPIIPLADLEDSRIHIMVRYELHLVRQDH